MNNDHFAQRSKRAVWHPCTQMKSLEALPPIAIQSARGMWLYDYDGKRYLDGISSWWVNLFGHANPRINAALHAQIDQLDHVMLAGLTHEPVIALSEKLSALTQSKLGHCFYGSDGASATEIALKMSFHFWRNNGKQNKYHFISVQNGYHGETLGALSVTDVAIFKDAYAPLMRCSAVMPSPDWRLAETGEAPRDFALRCAASVEKYLQQHHDTIAAFIVEPLVQGAAGMAMHHPVYLTRVRQLCSQYQVHLITDEIAVGFGRTGSFFAHAQASITPDFLCLSKGITGGYLPLSVVMTADEIYQAFYDDSVARGFLHSHSYTGNALACRAALAVLEIFEQDNVLEKNRATQKRLNELCASVQSHPAISHFRNTGMIWAFDVKTDNPTFARDFYQAALKNELLLRPIGNSVYFMPPYIIDDDEAKLLVDGALKSLDEVLRAK